MVNNQAGSAILKQESDASNRTIMLVDDDPVFRRFTSVILENAGYVVIEAEHGLEGLQILRQQTPDLILCDISMPILNGIEFAEEVSREYPDIPVIVVSATDDMSDVARALRFGIKDFLTKPITASQHLLAAVSNTLADAQKYATASGDFASQWLRVGDDGDIAEDEELHWHLEHLKETPDAARELLTALLPDRDTKQGKWKCSYNLLQASESMPLVFDYAWLSNGQFAFYLVDSSSDDGGGVAAALLVRAIFNDSLRHQDLSSNSLVQFVKNIERGIGCLEAISAVDALVGVADTAYATVTILPAGLEAIWREEGHKRYLNAGERLGEGCFNNKLAENLSIRSGGKLNIANIGVGHFSLDIMPK